jgi:GntP family gluconate:H+ symporter
VSTAALALIALCAIALLLMLILKIALHPFVALLLVSVLVALAAGFPPAKLVSVIEDGMGKTLGHIALIIPLGAMIGRLIEHSGGAAVFASRLIERFRNQRAPLALTLAGAMIGIPVFFEVGVIMLMPIAYGVARATNRPVLNFALPMCIALLVVHAILPPHPGPVAAVGLLGSDVGRVLLWGLPISAITIAGAYFVALALTRGDYAVTDSVRREVFGPMAAAVQVPGAPARPDTLIKPPVVSTVIALILLPIMLIMLGTLGATTLPTTSVVRGVMIVLGTPFVALLLDVLVCAYVLGIRRGWSRGDVSDVIGSAIPGIALVVLVTGAGGVFAQILISTGIGHAISDLLRSTGLPVLGLGFFLTLFLRVAQGPTTVALITTAGLLGPLIAQAGLNSNQLALICVAMGAGGMAGSHVNDAGFWIVTRLIGLSVADGLRTWTLLTTCAGFMAFLLTALLWFFV